LGLARRAEAVLESAAEIMRRFREYDEARQASASPLSGLPARRSPPVGRAAGDRLAVAVILPADEERVVLLNPRIVSESIDHDEH
jgi:hypothetical protein